MPETYRAFAFEFPAAEEMSDTVGMSVGPLGLNMVEGNASVRQAIMMLLSTRRGERVMRPHYGCDLHKLVFSVNDGTTAGLAIHYVRSALTRWEPRARILSLDAGPNPHDATRLDIALTYLPRGSRLPESLSLAVNLGGE